MAKEKRSYRRRYVLELTDAQIGILLMALEYQINLAEENRSYNTQRRIDYMGELYHKMAEIRGAGLKSIRNES